MTTDSCHRYVSGLRTMTHVSFSLFVAPLEQKTGGCGSEMLTVLAAHRPDVCTAARRCCVEADVCVAGVCVSKHEGD